MGLYTEPPHFVTGTKPTPAWLNTHVSDDLDYLRCMRMKWAQLVPGGTFQTTSTAYVDWNGASPLTMSYVKREADTFLVFFIYTTFFITGSANKVTFAVNDGTNDLQVYPARWVNEINEYQCVAGHSNTAITAAATLTLKLRVKVASAACTFNVNTFGYAAMRVHEQPL